MDDVGNKAFFDKLARQQALAAQAPPVPVLMLKDMTYHDWFAGQALARARDSQVSRTAAERARTCWDEADAMLAERKRRGEQRDKRLLD